MSLNETAHSAKGEEPEMVEELYFTADAALIDRLGRELVGKQETALIELVKNSFDADATRVTVTIAGDRLVIDDDGTGMRRDELIDGFLRLASDMKVQHPVSRGFLRRRAGRKGIGRFSTQRLGSYLLLRTWTKAGTPGLELQVNWQNFERGRALDRVPVTLQDVPARDHPGTRIEIQHLRDDWSEAQVRRCWRGVIGLQQPFPVARVASRPHQDPGFTVRFYQSGSVFEDPRLIADLQTEVLDHMHAVVEFKVDVEGYAEWRMPQNKFGATTAWTPINNTDPDSQRPSAYAHLRSVAMKAFYAILEPGEFSPMIFSRLRELLRAEGGIRLYRNGFRVIPYGEPDNDWIRLDEAYSRRSFLFPIANRNWFGVVEVHDPEGRIYEEHTSREGLIETPAFLELRDLASSVLITASQRIAEQRNRKTRAGGSKTAPTEFFLDRLRAASRKAREETDRLGGTGGNSTASLANAAELLGDAETIIKSAASHFADEAAMLRLLATLGLTAAEFSHETGMTFQAVRLDFREVLCVALEARAGDNEFVDLVQRVRSMVERLDALTSYLNELASARSARELAPVSVSRTIEDFARGMRQLATRSEIELVISTPDYDGLYTTPMHKAEVASILLNFYSNSVKALKRTTGIRRIQVDAERLDDEVVLRFSDTGDGISLEYRDRVFDLFFTTRTAVSTSATIAEESTGTGLGLWIVLQIVSRVEGTVAVVEPEAGYATTREVRFPGSADEEEEL